MVTKSHYKIVSVYNDNFSERRVCSWKENCFNNKTRPREREPNRTEKAIQRWRWSTFVCMCVCVHSMKCQFLK